MLTVKLLVGVVEDLVKLRRDTLWIEQGGGWKLGGMERELSLMCFGLLFRTQVW